MGILICAASLLAAGLVLRTEPSVPEGQCGRTVVALLPEAWDGDEGERTLEGICADEAWTLYFRWGLGASLVAGLGVACITFPSREALRARAARMDAQRLWTISGALLPTTLPVVPLLGFVASWPLLTRDGEVWAIAGVVLPLCGLAVALLAFVLRGWWAVTEAGIESSRRRVIRWEEIRGVGTYRRRTYVALVDGKTVSVPIGVEIICDELARRGGSVREQSGLSPDALARLKRKRWLGIAAVSVVVVALIAFG